MFLNNRELLNVVILGFSFMFIYTAFGTSTGICETVFDSYRQYLK